MKTDQPMDGAGAEAAHNWMEGLAGRPGTGTAHGEGARLRAALAPDAQDTPAATWHDIEARARAATAADGVAEPAVLHTPAATSRPGTAANDPRPWRKFAWAAALVLGVGLVTLMAPPEPTPEPALRGVGGAGAQGAKWRVEQPVEAAEALAAELRGLQADVSVKRDGEAVVLSIHARPGAVDAVNARLAGLETGLDAEGRLQLVVRPIR